MRSLANKLYRRIYRFALAAAAERHRLYTLSPIHRRFRPYTMISKHCYITNLELVETFKHVQGTVVECGTWKGGMIAGMAMVLGNDRQYFLFDSFEGLPPVKEIDGEAASKWQADTTSPGYHDNCTADENDALEAMELSGSKDFRIIKGWFNETLLSFNSKEAIAMLRLDADWYDSTLKCLKTLFPRVSKGGIIIVDDYYVWDGCSKAIHDYLSENHRPERICQFNNKVCFIVKE